MPVFKKKRGSVSLGCNGVTLGVLVNFQVIHLNFKAQLRAGVGLDYAGDGDAGFLPEFSSPLEQGLVVFSLGHDTLDDAGAIAQL